MFLYELLFDESTGEIRTDDNGKQRFPKPEFYGSTVFLFLDGINKVDQCAFYNLEDYKVDGVSAGAIWLRPLTPLELDEQKRGYSLSHTSL